MSRPLSNSAKQAIFAQQTDEAFIVLGHDQSQQLCHPRPGMQRPV